MSLRGPVKGWCPSAHRPMQSGDGWVVRVRPFLATLDRDQALGLCALADRFGQGHLDLTSRANLQIRGLAKRDCEPLLVELDALGLIHADPEVEAGRNILVAPDWRPGGRTERLHAALIAALPRLTGLPQKMGFALDTGQGGGCLAQGSADFRFEQDRAGQLILCADGAPGGRPVSEAGAIGALTELVDWFVATGGPQAGRMLRHLRQVPLPDAWQSTAARPQRPEFQPGPAAKVGSGTEGTILGAPFGRIAALGLARLIKDSGATGLRLMLGRMVWLRGVQAGQAGQIGQAAGFVTQAGDPLMQAHACPGAPFCDSASVETTGLARRLAATLPGPLHVSGCAKGCAHPRTAALTLTGRNGAFDLVTEGAPWDEPRIRGLRVADLTNLTNLTDLTEPT